MTKWTTVYPNNELLFSANKKWNIKLWRHEWTLNAFYSVKKKKPIWKDYMLNDSNCIIFWKRQDYGDSRQALGAQTTRIYLQCRRQFRSLGQEDPRRRKWQLTPVFLPEEIHGQRSLVVYSPWGHKELDTTLCIQLVCVINTHTPPNYTVGPTNEQIYQVWWGRSCHGSVWVWTILRGYLI